MAEERENKREKVVLTNTRRDGVDEEGERMKTED